MEKYLFFDIDGTLLSHTEGISPSTVEALRLCKEKGYKIFICTGRSYAGVPELIYSFNFDGIIAAAGGYVKVGDEVIFSHEIPDHLVDNIVYHLNKHNTPFILEGTEYIYTDKELLRDFELRTEELKKIKEKSKYEHSAYDYMFVAHKNIDEYYENRTPISAMAIHGDGPESYREFESFIDRDFYLIKYEKFADLVPKGVNKFTGIQLILDHFRANLKDTIAFGDSLNDYEMIKFCEIGVAVGNASDPLKEVADYITDDIHHDGIYNALKHFNII
ncbi:Cof-type HAD-IIB family hydrolase [Helcococcus kunzii]|uniref:Cof-type HAD-IIB family hydrolase n=1 Tax=Helcococcus kunzii TaxID=40091 RepID=UPI001BAF6E39|nr:Cof-type HAD-IIB family hydrolase [Helcococcus kunzii]QUY64172.1 Cof-type HAD-IIB family hydrolase [Helcococcus kunzii]QZO76628.1 Cof-type HAD-IIB family hydrolase [Helcococcus kunzii]